MNRQIIHLDNICFSYEKEMVLKKISMSFMSDRVTFVMGNNGSGKTTLLKNIIGFLKPQQGIINVNGKDISSINEKEISKIISYVPQAIRLNTDFSVIDYLMLGRTPHLNFIPKLNSDDYQIVEEISEKLGIVEFFETPFNKLSGGQKQTVAIARSLIQSTPVIVMDEPMSALDVGKQVELLKILSELSFAGKTIILTTHNPNHALAIDSDSCFLKQGEVVAAGESNTVMQNNLLNDIYGKSVMIENCGVKKSVIFEVGR